MPNTATFESRQAQAQAKRDASLLTDAEQNELHALWGGFEADMGVRSLHGSIQDKLMRSPPRDARVAILRELDRVGGTAPRETLLSILRNDGEATAVEAQYAINLMAQRGHIVSYIEDTVSYVKLGTPWKRAPQRLPTKQERWDREDAELEAYCLGGPSCHGEPPTTLPTGIHALGSTESADRARRALGRLTVAQRAVLHRMYGGEPESRYSLTLGSHASLAPWTPCVGHQMERIVARQFASALTRAADGVDVFALRSHVRRSVTANDALRESIDEAPLGEHRDAFIANCKAECEKMARDACLAYRKARVA